MILIRYNSINGTSLVHVYIIVHALLSQAVLLYAHLADTSRDCLAAEAIHYRTEKISCLREVRISSYAVEIQYIIQRHYCRGEHSIVDLSRECT